MACSAFLTAPHVGLAQKHSLVPCAAARPRAEATTKEQRKEQARRHGKLGLVVRQQKRREKEQQQQQREREQERREKQLQRQIKKFGPDACGSRAAWAEQSQHKPSKPEKPQAVPAHRPSSQKGPPSDKERQQASRAERGTRSTHSTELTQADIDAAVDAVRVVERAGTAAAADIAAGLAAADPAAAAAAVAVQGASSSSSSSRRGSGATEGDEGANKKLTTDIKYARSLRQLQELLHANRGSMNIINITAFLSRLPQLLQKRPASSSSSGGGSSHAGEGWHDAGVASARSAEDTKHLKHAQGLAREALVLLQPLILEVDGRGITVVLHALALLEMGGMDIIDDLLYLSIDFLPSMNSQCFSLLIYSLACLGVRPQRQWCIAFFRYSLPAIPHFNLQALSNTMWALARLRLSPLASGFNRDWERAMFAAVHAHLTHPSERVSAQALSLLAWAFSSLQLLPPLGLRAAMVAQAHRIMADFSPQGIAILLLGLARTHAYVTSSWMARFAEVTLPKLESYDTVALSTVLYALALLGHPLHSSSSTTQSHSNSTATSSHSSSSSSSAAHLVAAGAAHKGPQQASDPTSMQGGAAVSNDRRRQTPHPAQPTLIGPPTPPTHQPFSPKNTSNNFSNSRHHHNHHQHRNPKVWRAPTAPAPANQPSSIVGEQRHPMNDHPTPRLQKPAHPEQHSRLSPQLHQAASTHSPRTSPPHHHHNHHHHTQQLEQHQHHYHRPPPLNQLHQQSYQLTLLKPKPPSATATRGQHHGNTLSSVSTNSSNALQSSQPSAKEHLSAETSSNATTTTQSTIQSTSAMELWSAELQRVLQRSLHASSPRTTAILWYSFGSMGVVPQPPLLQALLTRAHQQLPAMGPHGVAITVWSLARLRLHPGPAWMDALMAHASKCMAHMKPEELSNLSWGLARLGHRPYISWLQQWASASARKLPAASPQSLCNMMRMLAKLRFMPGMSWQQASAQRLQECTHSMTRTQKARTLVSIAQLRLPLPRSLLEELSTSAMSDVLSVQADDDSVGLLLALVGLRLPPSRQWLEMFAGEAEVRTHLLPAPKLADIAAALASISYQPSPLLASRMDAQILRAQPPLQALQAQQGLSLGQQQDQSRDQAEHLWQPQQQTQSQQTQQTQRTQQQEQQPVHRVHHPRHTHAAELTALCQYAALRTRFAAPPAAPWLTEVQQRLCSPAAAQVLPPAAIQQALCSLAQLQQTQQQLQRKMHQRQQQQQGPSLHSQAPGFRAGGGAEENGVGHPQSESQGNANRVGSDFYMRPAVAS